MPSTPPPHHFADCSLSRNNLRFKILRSPRWRHSSLNGPEAVFSRPSIFSSQIPLRSMLARLWRRALAALTNQFGESSEVRLNSLSPLTLPSLSSSLVGHNVNYVDEIAVVYQKNFSADMRMLIRTKTSGRFQDALVSYLEYCSHPMDHSEETLLV
jgi:hypothetical protein